MQTVQVYPSNTDVRTIIPQGFWIRVGTRVVNLQWHCLNEHEYVEMFFFSNYHPISQTKDYQTRQPHTYFTKFRGTKKWFPNIGIRGDSKEDIFIKKDNHTTFNNIKTRCIQFTVKGKLIKKNQWQTPPCYSMIIRTPHFVTYVELHVSTHQNPHQIKTLCFTGPGIDQFSVPTPKFDYSPAPTPAPLVSLSPSPSPSDLSTPVLVFSPCPYLLSPSPYLLSPSPMSDFEFDEDSSSSTPQEYSPNLYENNDNIENIIESVMQSLESTTSNPSICSELDADGNSFSLTNSANWMLSLHNSSNHCPCF